MSDRVTAGVIAGYVHEVSDRHHEDQAANEAPAQESVAEEQAEEDAGE
jgi:hypothetical protein